MEWMTPGGVVNATLSSGGDFLLVLDNPVVGGNYTCRLSPHSPPAVCLTAGDPLLAQLVAENEQLKSDNSRLQMDLVSEQQSLDIMQQQLADLLKQMAEMQEHFG
nr:hypothetical protein BaRGS_034808 [Batillaria attramentaria]